MADVLLVEPGYKNKYPPLALMKLSTYHKRLGDNVYFIKGKIKEFREMQWDRIYVTTLFTFHWKKTIETIKYYRNSVKNTKDIFIGGVMATILAEEVKQEVDVTILKGLLDHPDSLGDGNDMIIDTLPLDYSIIDPDSNLFFSYKYPVSDAYFCYATRGCIRNCAFCAVPKIEPDFVNYIDIKEQVNYTAQHFGEKRNLLLMDNNVLASSRFHSIIDDIKELGFERDSFIERQIKTKNGQNRKIKYKRHVDFNQGIDARLLTEEHCRRLAEIAIDPLRLAFDNYTEEFAEMYKEKCMLAAHCGIRTLSNYMLFNFNDTPEELYKRLEVVADLNQYFLDHNIDSRIWSFPMRYSPVSGEFAKGRKYIGKHWCKKHIRAIQCILNATHGLVGHKPEYFRVAFGQNLEEFLMILDMPEKLIIKRNDNILSGNTARWRELYYALDKGSEEYQKILDNDFPSISSNCSSEILKYYL